MIDSELLSRYLPFSSLAIGNRANLARRLSVRTAAAGEYLFKLGERADWALFLIDGAVQLADAEDRNVVIRAGEQTAMYPLAHAPIRRVSGRCLDAVRYFAIEADVLDVILTWDQGRAIGIYEFDTESDPDDDDWMIRLLQMPLFHRVPPANLYGMFKHMAAMVVAPGQVLVRQGAAGDFFYVIIQGRCSVTRAGADGKAMPLAELDAGACFGEEALISEEPRNATVTMLTPGRLMRLAKADFHRLLTDPLARRLSYREALRRIDDGGGQWLDVRLPDEYRTGSLSRSLNLPLHLLRLKIPQLDMTKTYVTICDTGRRSSVAAWLLTQRGFDAYQLDSGLPAGP